MTGVRDLRIGFVALLLLITLCNGAFAQLDGGWHVIRQNGKVVGEIYVPAHEPGARIYVEHWVLYEDYVYPSPANHVTMEISPGIVQMYRNETDFFTHVRFAPGSRYVKVLAEESDQLPNPR